MAKKILLIGLIIILALTTSCKPDADDSLNWKLFSAISSNNLQGLKEVLNSDADIDFSDVGYTETTSFASSSIKQDSRALSIALTDSDEEIAKMLIDAGALVNNEEDDWTYLTWAISNCSVDVSRKLISKGADVNAGGEPPLEALIRYNYPNEPDYKKKMELLIDSGADINHKLMESSFGNEWSYLVAPRILQLIKDHNKKSGIEKGLEAAIIGDDIALQELVKRNKIKNKDQVLMFASANCSVETLNVMDKAGYDFTVMDDMMMNLLHIASLCNSKDVVEYLLDKGISGNIVSNNGYQAITYAAIGAKKETINLLFERGFDYQKGNFETFYEDDFIYVNTWEEVCVNGSVDSVKTLLELGYKLSGKDKHIAYAESNADVFDEIVKQKIPFNVLSNGDYPVDIAKEPQAVKLVQMGAKLTNTTLVNAIEWRNYDLVEDLLQKNIKQKNDENTSPLIAAIWIGDLESIRLLIKDGADVNQTIITDDGESSPLHIAAEQPSTDILQLLIEYGAEVHAKDSEGKTPYDYAKECNFKDNMTLLK